MSQSNSLSAAELGALRFLDTRLAGSVTREELYRYYQRNGPTGGRATVSRRGAAGRM